MAFNLQVPSQKALAQMKRLLPAVAVNSYRPFVSPHSRTLAAALKAKVVVTGPSSIELQVRTGYWWFGVLDDGRGPVFPKTKRYLVWFYNPKDDPRTRYGTKYPKSYEGNRRLTKREYQDGLEENRRRRALGQPPYMIVRNDVVGAGPFDGRHFTERARPVVSEELTDEIAQILVRDLREQIVPELQRLFKDL